MGGENHDLDWVISFPSFLIQKCLGEIFILWDLCIAFRPTFQKKKNLVLLRWKGISRCCAQKSCRWEQRQRVPASIALSQEERGDLKAAVRFSQISLDGLYNFNGGNDCFPMLIRYLLYLSWHFVCFSCTVSFVISFPCPFPTVTSLITLVSFSAASAHNTSHLAHKVIFKYGWKDDCYIRFTREKKQVSAVDGPWGANTG